MNEIRDLIIGIDLGEKYSQVSYYNRKDGQPCSLSMKVGSSVYETPTCLCRKVAGDYCVGLEAVYFAREKGGFLLDNLYALCGKEEPVQVMEEMKQPWELMAQFLRGLLKYLGVMDVVKNTRCLAVTSPSLSGVQVANLKKACESLGFPEDRYMLLDYGESFYYYVLTQKRETWTRSVAWYAFDGNRAAFRKLTVNSGVRPALVRLSPAQETELPVKDEERDDAFSDFIRDTMGTELFSSVQITGRGFDQKWAKESVKILCSQRRKVFFGNNLFAKGACAAGAEQTETHSLKGYQYMSDALVLTDVGMDMRVMGAPAYCPLIEAGRNWYECRAKCELILDDVSELAFVVKKFGDPEKKRMVMQLPGLPIRPNKTTRLSLELEYISREECRITVRDLGFGDMFPSSGKVWRETVVW